MGNKLHIPHVTGQLARIIFPAWSGRLQCNCSCQHHVRWPFATRQPLQSTHSADNQRFNPTSKTVHTGRCHGRLSQGSFGLRRPFDGATSTVCLGLEVLGVGTNVAISCPKTRLARVVSTT